MEGCDAGCGEEWRASCCAVRGAPDVFIPAFVVASSIAIEPTVTHSQSLSLCLSLR